MGCFVYPSISMELTGKWLQTLCRLHGLRARDLQVKLSLASVQSVYDWFHGRTLPSLENLCALAQLLDCPVEELLIERHGILLSWCREGQKSPCLSYYRMRNKRKSISDRVFEEIPYQFWIQPVFSDLQIKVLP